MSDILFFGNFKAARIGHRGYWRGLLHSKHHTETSTNDRSISQALATGRGGRGMRGRELTSRAKAGRVGRGGGREEEGGHIQDGYEH